MVMACSRINQSSGFTLIEILVGLAVAGILASIIAGVMGQGILTSETLLRESRSETQKTVLRRLLHRDIKNMVWESDLEPTPDGFRINTGHNTLTSCSLPVETFWNFSNGKIIRFEESQELSYEKKQILSHELNYSELEFLSFEDNRWIRLESWLMSSDRAGPRAMRVRLEFDDGTKFEMVEHLPFHE